MQVINGDANEVENKLVVSHGSNLKQTACSELAIKTKLRKFGAAFVGKAFGATVYQLNCINVPFVKKLLANLNLLCNNIKAVFDAHIFAAIV